MNSKVTPEMLSRFWLIIDGVPADIKIDEENNYDLYSDFLNRILSKAPQQELKNFDITLHELKLKLERANLKWGDRTYGLSDDGFDYFCYWVISRGSMIYNGTIEDITRIDGPMNQVVNTEFEDIAYVVSKIWKKKFPNEEYSL
jgi:Protein of unknown function (DUF4240)